MTKKIIRFALILPFVFHYGCQSNSKPKETNEKKSLNTECDCKKYAVNLKFKLPESSDFLILLNKSFKLTEGGILVVLSIKRPYYYFV